MKICFVSHSGDIGGAELSLLYLLKTLNKYPSTKALVVLPSKGGLTTKLDEAKISYIIQPYKWWTVRRGEKINSVKTTFRHHLDDALKLGANINKFKPDLIVTNTSVLCVGALVANSLNIPHIWYVRELGEKDHGFIFEYGLAFTSKFINAFSSKVIFNSRATEKEFDRYVSKDKSIVIYNSIDTDNMLPKEHSKFDFNFSKSFKLLIAGTISKKKGQLDAIRATTLLLAEKMNIELLILGRCTDKKLTDKINSLINTGDRKTYIQMKDFVDNPYPLFRKCNAVLVCSKSEAFGRTILEGMLLKKPVIATNSGGVPEIIKNGENGLLYRPGNYRELANKIKLLINNPKLAKKISANGFHIAKTEFSNKNYSYKLKRIFESDDLVVPKTATSWIKKLRV